MLLFCRCRCARWSTLSTSASSPPRSPTTPVHSPWCSECSSSVWSSYTSRTVEKIKLNSAPKNLEMQQGYLLSWNVNFCPKLFQFRVGILIHVGKSTEFRKKMFLWKEFWMMAEWILTFLFMLKSPTKFQKCVCEEFLDDNGRVDDICVWVRNRAVRIYQSCPAKLDKHSCFTCAWSLDSKHKKMARCYFWETYSSQLFYILVCALVSIKGIIIRMQDEFYSCLLTKMLKSFDQSWVKIKYRSIRCLCLSSQGCHRACRTVILCSRIGHR